MCSLDNDLREWVHQRGYVMSAILTKAIKDMQDLEVDREEVQPIDGMKQEMDRLRRAIRILQEKVHKN